jgi:hypothetical protein
VGDGCDAAYIVTRATSSLRRGDLNHLILAIYHSQTDLSVLCIWGPKMSAIGLYKIPSDGACSGRLIWLTSLNVSWSARKRRPSER